MGLDESSRELVHHHAAIFSVGDLTHQRRNGAGAQGLAAEAKGLVAGLHLTHQLGIGALGFDQGGDAHRVAAGVAGHQAVGDQGLLPTEAGAIGIFNAVLLHQQPAVATLPQGLDKGIEGVGVVGQVHLRRRKTLHPLQGLGAKQGGEMVLPGQDLQLEIGDRRGGGHRMAPEGAEPLHVGLQARVTGEGFKGGEDVLAAHLLETPEQIPRIIEHDPGIAALANQLGNDLGKSFVAVGKGIGVVVITLARVLIHVLQMGDQLSVGPGWNRGLMHVERTGKS